jgi:hypothetical protein
VTRYEREAAQREARAQSLDDTIARFEAERVEADTALAAVRAESAGTESAADLAPRLAAARQAATAAREAAAAARSALDQETRETAGRPVAWRAWSATTPTGPSAARPRPGARPAWTPTGSRPPPPWIGPRGARPCWPRSWW